MLVWAEQNRRSKTTIHFPALIYTGEYTALFIQVMLAYAS